MLSSKVELLRSGEQQTPGGTSQGLIPPCSEPSLLGRPRAPSPTLPLTCVLASFTLISLSLTPGNVHFHSPEWNAHYSLSAEMSRAKAVVPESSFPRPPPLTPSPPPPPSAWTPVAQRLLPITWDPGHRFQQHPQ